MGWLVWECRMRVPPSHPLPTLFTLLPLAGETQASYFAEGLLDRRTSGSDAVARKLLTGAVFYVIPNMCPGEREGKRQTSRGRGGREGWKEEGEGREREKERGRRRKRG
jgi:hypothetical protein